MGASRLRTLMKSRLLVQVMGFFSLCLLISISAYALPSTCANMDLGNGASLNGFLPYSGNPNNMWNQNISSAPLDPNSANIMGGIPWNHHLHPDFGPEPGGIPYVIVDSSTQPFVNIVGLSAGPITPDQSYASQSDAVVEPAPLTAPIEGGQPDCLAWPPNQYDPETEGDYYYFGDTHMLVIDRNQCWAYETYLTSRCDGVFNATGQAIWDLYKGEQRPWGWTSTDAAGDSVFVGLMKYDEVYNAAYNSQPIQHAVRFTVEQTKGDGDGGYFVLPDTHAAAYGSKYKNLSVMGMQLRLKASTNLSSYSVVGGADYSPMNMAVFTALQNYGMILADNGGDLYISGATDARWNVNDLGNWHGGGSIDCADNTDTTGATGCYLSEADFEVVQMSVGVGVPDMNLNDPEATPTDETWSYMDANSAPYTVYDVEDGTYTGGLGPEGTALTGSGKYPVAGPTGVTGGLNPPSINSFEAHYTIFGFPIPGNICGNTVLPGLPIAFTYNITSSVPVISGMGDFYSYIDNAGPVRVDGAGNGILYVTPSESQEYTLYSMNADGMAISSSCNIAVGGSVLPIPVFSPIGGTYSTITNVVISVPGYPGATIYYTTDQSIPSIPAAVNSTQMTYTGPITLTNTCTPNTNPPCPNYFSGEEITAIAVDPLFMEPSDVGSAVYAVDALAATPVITPPSGTYDTQPTITITDSTIPIDTNQDGDSVWIYYTTDGSIPTGDAFGDTCTPDGLTCNPSTQYYWGPFTLPLGALQINAIADAVGYAPSMVATNNYGTGFTVVAGAPTLIIQPGSTAGSISFTITSVNGYTGTVNMSCTNGLPPGDTCTFNPSSVTVALPPAPAPVTTLTVDIGLNAHNNNFPLLPGGATLAVALCFFGLRKRRRLQILFLLAVSVIGLSLFTGCGTPGSLPNTVTVTVTGTDSSGSPTTSTTFVLTQMQIQ